MIRLIMEFDSVFNKDELSSLFKTINFMKFRSLKHNIKNILEEKLYDCTFYSIKNELSKKIWASKSDIKTFHVKEFTLDLEPLVKCHGISLDEIKEELLHDIDIMYISQLRGMFPCAKFNCNFTKEMHPKFKFSIEFTVDV
jgi:hypothetical protein